mgnify:CR=1 FL=1
MEMQQQYVMKLQMLEQEANQFGEQLKIIKQQIKELGDLKENLKVIEGSDGKDIFAEFGKGIYIQGKLTQGKALIDVGNKVFVPKSFEEVEKIVDEQVSKLGSTEKEIGKRIEMINSQLNDMINQMHEMGRGQEEKECACHEGEECKCEESECGCEEDSKKN